MQHDDLKFKWQQLELWMSEAIKRADDGTCKRVSDSLIPILPELMGTLRDIITDQTSTPIVKMRCLEIVMSAWAKCLRSELRTQRAAVAQDRFRAKKSVADAQRIEAAANDKLAALEISKQRKKIARQLKLAEQAAKKRMPAFPNVQKTTTRFSTKRR